MDARIHQLHALSPLDGRYQQKVARLSSHLSEFALIKYRLHVEVEYLLFLATKKICPAFSSQQIKLLRTWASTFSDADALEIKAIESKIHHDVKAVEYFLRGKMEKATLPGSEWIHFGLTSEDTNSLAYGLMIHSALEESLLPKLDAVISALSNKALQYADSVMLARTHGQPAVPTTMGKELAVFAVRLRNELKILKTLPIEGKCTGAVGNFNALSLAFPTLDWVAVTSEFVKSLGLTPNGVTTQILPADSYARIFSSLTLIHTIMIGLCQDLWRYISDGYFTQRVDADQVGSSTMPQKVNPIDFENAEGNLGLANALFEFFVRKLPLSRLQRDLSESTIKRSIGIALGYSVVAYGSLATGLDKLSFNESYAHEELSLHWEIITEGMQTLLRANGDATGYEKLKEFSRGQKITEESLRHFIDSLDVDLELKEKLRLLSPSTYVGIASAIVTQTLGEHV